MGESIEHHCGLALAHTMHDLYSMMEALEHRGQEAAGIAAVGTRSIDVLKWVGGIRGFGRENLERIFPFDDYHTYIGHVRYSTSGKKDLGELLKGAHPQTIGGRVINHGNHMLVLGCEKAMVHNGQIDVLSLEGIVNKNNPSPGCDTEALLQYFAEQGARNILRRIPGAYTLIIADRSRTKVMVMRDPTGIRIGVLGSKGGKSVVASEDIAIRKSGGVSQGDLSPGAIYYIDNNGQVEKKQIIDNAGIEAKLAHCMFEYLYLSDPESVIDGVSVRRVRELLGQQLAKEYAPKDIDFVTHVPNSPEAAARKYADELGVPFLNVFYKPNARRSFIEGTNEARKTLMRDNFYLLPSAVDIIKGKKIVVIDDSLVRGTVVTRVRELLYQEARVDGADFLSYTPPIGIIGNDGIPRGCMYGVDMPPTDKFIARIDGANPRNATSAEINEKIGMSVKFLSREGLDQVFNKVGLPPTNLCQYCIGGEAPYNRNQILRVVK
ncbi:MAG TPA: hypothetical protein VJI98_02400 [Candidatus Nanoarchaeia archaeon]|nr:hypothetical protein [Candidatus Nanoarchaeia archaeon]